MVLARYLQIISDDLCRELPGRIINIHHSFLAHFVTSDLDEGPIIAQDVTAVSHRDTAEQMVAKGRDIERLVLSRVVTAQAEDRIFPLDDRTVVFD